MSDPYINLMPPPPVLLFRQILSFTFTLSLIRVVVERLGPHHTLK